MNSKIFPHLSENHVGSISSPLDIGSIFDNLKKIPSKVIDIGKKVIDVVVKEVVPEKKAEVPVIKKTEAPKVEKKVEVNVDGETVKKE